MKMFSPDAFQSMRKMKGITQKSLGEAIGTSERMVRKWEGGTSEPTASYLLRAMALLNCTPQDLLKDPSPQD